MICLNAFNLSRVYLMSVLEYQLKNLKWPKFDQSLFKTEDDFNWMNACIDSISNEEKFYIYAEGYREAAEIVFNNLDSKDRYIDILIYPIVFLYRQSIELFLKDIIITGNKIQCIPQEYPKNHILNKLWQEAKIMIIKTITNYDKKDIFVIDKLIDDFDKIDPFSFAFRYPENKNGSKSLENIKKINLKNFHEVVLGILNFLDGVTSSMAEYYENIE
jgi:hypothetical protein